MRRHRYPHGRSTGGIRVHNGICIRIRKVQTVPVDAEFIRTVFSLLFAQLVLMSIVSRDRLARAIRYARAIIGLIAIGVF